MAQSTTCKSKSASLTSSNVEWNAFTKWCGNLLINPTVSDKRIAFPLSNLMFRIDVSSVAKSISFSNTNLSSVLDTFSRRTNDLSNRTHPIKNLFTQERISDNFRSMEQQSERIDQLKFFIPRTIIPYSTGNEFILLLKDGSIINPDGSITHLDGSITHPDGSITHPDGSTTHPDGSKTYPEEKMMDEVDWLKT